MNKVIARVFPRRTNATPLDKLAFVGEPDLLTPEWFDEIHISVTFTYDLNYAEKLAKVWSERTDKVLIGGPATGMRGECFILGMYIKFGYVITSRGCPNNCWFCSVPEREGNIIRELPIVDGWNILDDNLLACSDKHIQSVFDMLHRVKRRYHQVIEFTGGLEAKRLRDWHLNQLSSLKPKQIFFAYDTSDDYEPLLIAGKMLNEAINKNALRCYVLCGYKGDTFELAETRMKQTIKAGFIPMAMLYCDEKGERDRSWFKFQREWTRPAIMRAKGLI